MNRDELYFDMSTKLSSIDDSKLCEMLKKGDLDKVSWGTNHVIKIGKASIFAKKIPLTQIEFDNAFSTKNHYDLPMVYNYGIGSAGFGAFRELRLHIKTTNWVLSKACQNFPLMYHYRIIKRTDKADIDLKRHRNYIKHWGGNKNIAKYIKARYHSPYEIVLFLEYIPNTFRDYLGKDKKPAVQLAKQVLKTIGFLKQEKIIHLDLHFSNILTDGVRPYITDFGLGLDKSFDLSIDEIKFFMRHVNYDYGEFIECMGDLLVRELYALPDAQRNKLGKLIDLKKDDSDAEELEKIINSLDILKANGIFNLPKSYIDFLNIHKSTILLTSTFFEKAIKSNVRDKLFSSRKLQHSLQEAGVIN